ncbi:MAG TPA: hypothetical protein VN643_23220 [Pyrinomonadaceae bacterium]|nr:hypothetical protein [Pyrinomonadaceae bacterium]
MKTKISKVLFLLLLAAKVVAQEPVPERPPFIVKDPSVIHFELIPSDDRGFDKRDDSLNKPYEEGAQIVIGMDAVNTSQEAVRIIVFNQWSQDRPELLRSGDKVEYRKEIRKGVEQSEWQPPDAQAQVVKLEPGKRLRIASFQLHTWYGPLEAGHYQLVVKHRFQHGQEWIASAPIIFEVVLKKRDTRQ